MVFSPPSLLKLLKNTNFGNKKRLVQKPISDETLPKVFIKKPCYNKPLPDFRFFFRKGGVDAGGSLWWVACS